MFISEASENQIIEIIESMKLTNATGIDGFKGSHLKDSKLTQLDSSVNS
jgi:hypothetical protein